MADISLPEEKAARFGMLGAGFGLGFVLGPLIGGLLGEWKTYRCSFGRFRDQASSRRSSRNSSNFRKRCHQIEKRIRIK